MKVALIQMNSQADKAANLRTAAALIVRAVAEERPDLVALPEVFTHLGDDQAAKRAAAEPLPGGEAYALLQGLAREHGIVIHGGSLLEQDGDELFNTTVAFDRDGRELARYRKIHRFDIVTPDGQQFLESATFGAGARTVIYDALGTRVGCSICYDVRFPELYRALTEAGAKLIVVPAAFTRETGRDHWEVLLRARAIETQSYVLAPAQWGPSADGRIVCYGHSLVVDPWGHVIARASDGVGYVAARLELDRVERVRERMPIAAHRVL